MLDSFTDKYKSISPLHINNSISLNSAMDWKIWVKVSDHVQKTNFNQPTTIQFNENDNIDDLKNKIFNKFSSLRLSNCNDNTSIAVGFVYHSNSNDTSNVSNNNINNDNNSSNYNNANYNDNNNTYIQHPLAKVGSNTDIHFVSTDNSSNGYNNNNNNNNNDDDVDNNNHLIGVDSKRYTTVPQPPLIKSSLHLSSQFLIYAPMSKTKSLSCTMDRKIPSPDNLKRVLNYTSELLPYNLHRIIFEPDELVKNIYLELFGSLGLQSVSEPLIVYLSENIRQTDDKGLDSSEFNNYIPTNEEISEQLQLHSPYGGSKKSADLSDNVMTEQFNSNNRQEYRLITNEEQLRKLSESIDEEMRSPKQAILLLPKSLKDDSKHSFQQHSRNDSTSTISSIGNKINEEIVLSASDDLLKHNSLLIDNEVKIVEPTQLKINYDKDNNPITANISNVFLNLHSNESANYTPAPNTPHKGLNMTSETVFPKITVLIVEDNVINQTVLASFLRKHKISYKVAKNGREAVDIWKEGGIHLIFMDLQLPVLSGIDAAKEIRDYEKKNGLGIQKIIASSSSSTINLEDTKKMYKSYTGAPVIIVAFTASNSLTDKREALVSGCNDYLTKPVNLHWLSKKITEWGCMQGLINFDNWKQGQSRMTERVLVKQAPKLTPRPSTQQLPSRSSSTSVSNAGLNIVQNIQSQ